MSNLAPAITFDSRDPVTNPAVRRSWTTAESEFDFTGVLQPVVELPSSSGEVTVDDIIYDQQVGATVRYDGQVAASRSVSYESLDPTIGTVDSVTGYVSWISDGTCRLLARGPYATRRVDLALSKVNGQSINTFNRYVGPEGLNPGSLAYHLCANVDDVINGLTANDASKKIFSSIAAGPPTSATRSTTCWGKDYNLTCISPGNSNAYNQNCVALTDDIVVYTGHYAISHGSTIYFVGSDNTVYSRTLSTSDLFAPGGLSTDIRLGKLSSALPAAITPAKVLPSTWQTYLPSVPVTTTNLGPTLPVVYYDKESKLLVREMYYYQPAGSNYTAKNTGRQPTTAPRSNFYEDAISGDSNGSLFFVINGSLVWLGVVADITPAPQTYITELNSLITALGSSTSLSTVDLSGFNTY